MWEESSWSNVECAVICSKTTVSATCSLARCDRVLIILVTLLKTSFSCRVTGRNFLLMPSVLCDHFFILSSITILIYNIIVQHGKMYKVDQFIISTTHVNQLNNKKQKQTRTTGPQIINFLILIRMEDDTPFLYPRTVIGAFVANIKNW